jgi:hypothetical protein
MERGQKRLFIKEIEAVKIYNKETGEVLTVWPEKENSKFKAAPIIAEGEEDLLPKEQWEHNFYV